MSQLSPLVSGLQNMDEALSYVKQGLFPIQSKTCVKVLKSCGRILAQDIYALRSVPPSNNSAVDGFGIAFEDYLKGFHKFPIKSHIFAEEKNPSFLPQTAVKINTGAKVPDGVNAILMKEDCQAEGGSVKIPLSGLTKNMNIRFAGEDVLSGEKILHKNHKISSPDIALMVSQGISFVEVFSRLRIGVISTGSELVDVSGELDSVSVIDCNRPILISTLKEMGHKVTDLGIISDDKNSLQLCLSKYHKNLDVIVTSGGMSAGEADLVFSVISDLGELYVHGLAIKPGRPVGIGRIGNCLICGLPGNPVAAYTCLLFIVAPLLRYLSNLDVTVSHETILAGFEYKKRASIREFIRISTKKDYNNQTIGYINGKKGAAMVSSLRNLSGFAVINENIEKIKKRDNINFISIKELIS